MPSVSRSAQNAPPARPSISPLSATSKTFRSSSNAAKNAAMKDVTMREHEEAIETSESGDAETGEQPDDHSSSLSEPDDENDDVEEDDTVGEETLNGNNAAAQQLLDDDSEAETERIEPTPQKARKHVDSLGRTPSKLSQTATAAEELSEPPSPLAAGVGAASSTSTVVTAGQKRKRSETADSSLTSADSDIGESPRKKTHELPPNALDDVDEPLEHVEQSTENGDRADDTPGLEDARETPSIPTKPTKGRKGGRWKKKKEPAEAPEPQATEDAIEAEEPVEEKEAKTEEEIQAKKEASSTYDNVTKLYKAFREKLNSEQLATLEAEAALLSEKSLVHPEYLKQVACVDARLQKQKAEAHAFFNYRLRSIRERTLGERSQLHSQYYQSVRELREDVLYHLGEDWHAIQKERRQSHQERDDAHVYKFQPDTRLLRRNQAKYNQEVSVLSGVAKWIGFPAAPVLEKVEGDSFEEDMRAMKISKRVHQSNAAPARPLPPPYYPGPSVTAIERDERLAHENFLQQNPWARPQASIHAPHPTPAINHTPDWAVEPSTGGHTTAKQLIRNLSGQVHRTTSPYATPLTQKRPLPEHNSSGGTLPLNSDGPDPRSSLLAAPPTTSRVELLNQGSSNQTSPVTFPKQRNGAELTGFRNISNISGISGASTIDAPPDPHDTRERHEAAKATMPSLTHVSSASHSVFDTSQLHRHPRDEREVYSNVGFRVQEGAYGTPAPLPPPRDGGP